MIPTHCFICNNKFTITAMDILYCGVNTHKLWINPYNNNHDKIRQLQIIDNQINICWHFDYKYISFNDKNTNVWFEPDISDYNKLMNKIRKLLIFL